MTPSSKYFITFFLLVSCYIQVFGELDQKDYTQKERLENDKVSKEMLEDLVYDGAVSSEWTTDDLKKLNNQATVTTFLEELQKGLLGKQEVFSLRDPATLEETIAIVDLFYFTQDFQELYKVGCILKPLLNKEQFLYTLGVVLLHREDLHVSLPPWYEVFPTYFIRNSILKQFHKAKEEGTESLTLEVNHDNDAGSKDPLRYFREDVELSNSYYNFMLSWPIWWQQSKYSVTPVWNKRGEFFIFFRSQLAMRYFLEKYANNLSALQFPTWVSKQISDDPDLINAVDKEIYPRDVGYENLVFKHPNKTFLMETIAPIMFLSNNLKLKINDSFTTNLVNYKEWDTSKLGDILFNTSESVNPEFYKSFYEALWSVFSGESPDHPEPFNRTMMAYPMSALRSEASYHVFQLYDMFVADFVNRSLPVYTREELLYSGVTVSGFATDKLETFFDYKEFDISKALDSKSEPGKYKIRVKRLNHKPFSFQINITSTKAAPEQAIVRLFLYPGFSKVSEFVIRTEAFVLIDKFPVHLTPGNNIIDRHSHESTIFVEDNVQEHNTDGQNTLKNKVGCSLPPNLMLPKGDVNGLDMNLFVMVSPFSPSRNPEEKVKNFPCSGIALDDKRSLGFPWDRDHNDGCAENELSNVSRYNITIFHSDT